jgi:hypothetical protein
MEILKQSRRGPAGGRQKKRSRGWIVACVCLVTISPALLAQPAPIREYQLKAVFLFNFAQFVHWPPETFPTSQTPFVIGVLGDDPFGPSLDEAVRGEQANNHPLVIQRYRRVEDIGDCQVLFISQSESAQLEQIFNRLKGRSILTVGDADEFTRRGGMIRFVTEKNRVRLRVNLEVAKASHLAISSKLLRPAEIVTTREE